MVVVGRIPQNFSFSKQYKKDDKGYAQYIWREGGKEKTKGCSVCWKLFDEGVRQMHHTLLTQESSSQTNNHIRIVFFGSTLHGKIYF